MQRYDFFLIVQLTECVKCKECLNSSGLRGIWQESCWVIDDVLVIGENAGKSKPGTAKAIPGLVLFCVLET